MYCSVVYSFQGDVMSWARALVFKVPGTLKLKYGDVVVVATKHGEKLGVVNSVFEKDDYNYLNLYRTDVLKKLHGNTVAAAVRKRFAKFSDVSLIGKQRRKLRKEAFKAHGDDAFYYILQGLCLGNIYGCSHGVYRVFFNGYIICYREQDSIVELVSYAPVDKQRKWVNSTKALEEFNKLYEKKFGIVPKIK